VETVRDGQNRLTVTLTANPAQTNGLTSVTIGGATNAVVEAGQPATTVSSTLPLTGKPVSTTFYVRRMETNVATTVHLTVQDGCGEWKTFVGGGPGSF
jgi:hypothetical protein